MATGGQLSAYPPEGLELKLIEGFISLGRKRVLEVGCGDGRVTFQYAEKAAFVLAFDPDRPSIDEARWQQADRGIENIDFRIGSVERLPDHGPYFDVALFSWSL